MVEVYALGTVPPRLSGNPGTVARSISSRVFPSSHSTPTVNASAEQTAKTDGSINTWAIYDGSNLLWVDENCGQDLAHDEFDRILERLPRNCQKALLHQRRDGWSYQRIAQELGVSPSTVKDYIVEALTAFRTHFPAITDDREARERA